MQSAPASEGPTVQLAFPALTEHVRLARLVASGLVAQAGFSVDEIEDLRIAVDELCSLLVDHAAPDSRIELAFTLDHRAITMVGSAPSGSAGDGFEADELSRLILRAAVDHHTVRGDGGRLLVELCKLRPDRTSDPK